MVNRRMMMGGGSSRSVRRAGNGDDLPRWNGVPEIGYRWYNAWADPDLVYKGYEFNYYDIADALWDMYLEDGGDEDDDDAFAEYVRENAVPYLDDVIFGGYFAPGSTSWHDSYR